MHQLIGYRFRRLLPVTFDHTHTSEYEYVHGKHFSAVHGKTTLYMLTVLSFLYHVQNNRINCYEYAPAVAELFSTHKRYKIERKRKEDKKKSVQ